MPLKTEIIRKFKSNGMVAELNLNRMRSSQDFEIVAQELQKFYDHFWVSQDNEVGWLDVVDTPNEYIDDFFDEAIYLKPEGFFKPKFVFDDEIELKAEREKPITDILADIHEYLKNRKIAHYSSKP